MADAARDRLPRLLRHLGTWLGRSGLGVAALLTLLGFALSVVPGFDVLDYHASLVVALAGAPSVGFHCARRARSALDAARRSLLLAAIPFGLLALNAVRVLNCDPLEGAAFFLVGPTASMLFAGQLGRVVGGRGWLFLTIWLIWVGRNALLLYTEPTIFAFDPFVGWYSGAVYDTSLRVGSRFLLYRLLNLVVIGLIILGAAAARERSVGRRRGALLVALALAWGGLWGLRGTIGFEIDRESLEAALGGRMEAPGLVLHYDAAHIEEQDARRTLEDAAWRLESLARRLGAPYEPTVHVYLYGSQGRKGELMGGRRVAIARPWAHEVHLNPVGFGHPVVEHELAHVVLGAWSPPPFHIPAAWRVMPRMAVVEGAAEALEGAGGELDLHQWAAAMRRAELAPDLEGILDPAGFYGQPAAKAYTLSGSLMRWILETRGPEVFLDAYRDGDLGRALGQPLREVLDAWGGHLDALELPRDAVARARLRFDVKGVFQRVCPLEVGRLGQEAQALAARGRVEEALTIWRTIARFDPQDPRKRAPIVVLLAHEGRVEEAAAEVEAALALPGADEAMAAFLHEVLGDARWRGGDLQGARRTFADLEDAPQSEARRRNVLVKRDVVASESLEPILGPYLLEPHRVDPDVAPELGEDPDAEAIAYLVDAASDLPAEPLALYLLGRRLGAAGRWDEALGPLGTTSALLEAGRIGSLKAATAGLIRRENLTLLASARYHIGAFDEARETWSRAARLTPHQGQRATYQDEAARARWRAELAPGVFY